MKLEQASKVMMRALLYEAAQVMLTRVQKWSWLKAWAMTIAKRRGSAEGDRRVGPTEGYLRERLRLDFAKAIGQFDELDLLGVVGRAQVARLRYSAEDAELDDGVPFQSVMRS